MGLTFFKNTFFILVLTCFSCGSKANGNQDVIDSENKTIAAENQDTILKRVQDEGKIITGADQPEKYLPFLKGKKVGVVANQTSVLFYQDEINIHLVDFLLQQKIIVTKAFAPEHGFRGTADAGEVIKDGVDSKTGIPLISLYGKNKKPSANQLKDIDIMVFDIQDVGARFYTYISTLHYVMEACAEANIPLLILDRPNPNGHYIDGPILETQHNSFVGMHPIPVVHGMTIGEYAHMINGEGWLENKIKCELKVVQIANYNHDKIYSLPIKPSPNLPNDQSINLYPSLCFFEGTFVSAGRGTDSQFQIFGAPSLSKSKYGFNFTPQANEGAKYPKFKGEKCNGIDLREYKKLDALNLQWLIDAYEASGKRKDFFNDFFTNLAGTKKLQQQIESGITFSEIKKSWESGLDQFKIIRKKYLFYN